jgi:hypothetical protein
MYMDNIYTYIYMIHCGMLALNKVTHHTVYGIRKYTYTYIFNAIKCVAVCAFPPVDVYAALWPWKINTQRIPWPSEKEHGAKNLDQAIKDNHDGDDHNDDHTQQLSTLTLPTLTLHHTSTLILPQAALDDTSAGMLCREVSGSPVDSMINGYWTHLESRRIWSLFKFKRLESPCNHAAENTSQLR